MTAVGRAAAAVVAAAALTLTGCAGGVGPAVPPTSSSPTSSSPTSSSPTSSAPTSSAHFSAGGMDVTVSVAGWDGRSGELALRFTPLRPTYHLYSVSLPADGVDGVGRPTTAVVRGAVASTGRLSTTAPLHALTLPGVAEPLEVYPDAPLTATLPIRRGADGAATVLVSYAACSETYGCQVPVSGHPVVLRVSGSSISLGAPS